MTQKRQPKGIPVGGQFAVNDHADADAPLVREKTRRPSFASFVHMSFHRNITVPRQRYREAYANLERVTHSGISGGAEIAEASIRTNERYAAVTRGIDNLITDLSRGSAERLPTFLRKVVWRPHWGTMPSRS